MRSPDSESANGQLILTSSSRDRITPHFIIWVIARNIEAALERNFNVNVDNVTLKVSNGVVTLSGTVANWSAWQATYNTAAYTSGVINVIDQLTIRYA